MSPPDTRSRPFCERFPRVSGDEPEALKLTRLWSMFSPREWG